MIKKTYSPWKFIKWLRWDNLKFDPILGLQKFLFFKISGINSVTKRVLSLPNWKRIQSKSLCILYWCSKLILHFKYVSSLSIIFNSSVANGYLLFGYFFNKKFIPENVLEINNPSLIPPIPKYSQFWKSFVNVLGCLAVFLRQI